MTNPAIGDEKYLGRGDANTDGSVRVLWVADQNGDGLPDGKLQSRVGGAWLDMVAPISVPTATTATQPVNLGQVPALPVSLPSTFLKTGDTSLTLEARLSDTIDAREFSIDFSGADVDNGPAWTNFINACRRNRRKGVCPAGRSIVKSTITTDYGAQGVVIEGSGRGPANSGLLVGTELVWGGTMGAGTTMLTLDGNLWWSLRGLRLKGAATDGAATGSRVETLLRVEQTSTQVGSGTHHFSDMVVRDADYGIRYGAASSNNTDTTLVEMIYAKNLGVFFSAENNQCLGFVFNMLFLSGCNSCLRFWSGAGNFVVNGLYPTGCGNTGSDDWIVDLQGGTNGWMGVINDFRPETTCQHWIRVKNDGHLIVHGLTDVANSDATRMIELDGGSLEIRGGILKARDTALTTQPIYLDQGTGRQPHLLIENVVFAPSGTFTDFVPYEWIGAGPNCIPRVDVVGGMNYATRSRIPDFGTQADGRVGSVMRTATVSNAAAVLSHFLVATSTYYNQPRVSTPGLYEVVIMGVDNTAARAVNAVFRRLLHVDFSGTSNKPAIVTTETLGTDYNPNSLTAPAFVVATTGAGFAADYLTLRITVTGRASVNLTWSARVRLLVNAGPRLFQ